MMQRKNIIGLLVLIVLLVILISMAVVIFSPMRHPMKILECQNNLQEMYVDIIIYSKANGCFPEGGSPNFWNCLRGKPTDKVQPIAQDNRIFMCPFIPIHEGSEADSTRLDYTYPAKLPRVDYINPNRVLARDKLSNHGQNDTINILTVNGKVEACKKTTELFKQIIAGKEPYGTQLGDE